MPSTVLLRHSHVSWQCSWRVVKWSRNVEKTARHFASPAANKMAHSAAAQHAKVRWRQNVCASKLFCRFPLKSFVYRILIMSRIRIVVPTNETILKNDLENKTSKLSWGRSSVKSGRYWKPPWHPTMASLSSYDIAATMYAWIVAKNGVLNIMGRRKIIHHFSGNFFHHHRLEENTIILQKDASKRNSWQDTVWG